tara:strand:+ start:154 stop:1083 length:930 start_codon:yes stop_codon:yes gene_type:complete
MFSWKKLGLVFTPSISCYTSCMVPTPVLVNDQLARCFYTACDSSGIGRVFYYDFNPEDPTQIYAVSSTPVLDIGQPGFFDENGVLCCSVVKITSDIYYMYYVGFELGTKIRYRLLTGLAVSYDSGITFNRYSLCPILERSPTEPFFRGGPFCVRENSLFRLWYCAGNSWETINGKSMPKYNIHYIESIDGINWPSYGTPAITCSESDEFGFGRPSIYRHDSRLIMFYSIRKRSINKYRLGFAISDDDGLTWKRLDDSLNLSVSPDPSFDSDAIMYSVPFIFKSNLYLFYNGNNFGSDGIAVAKLSSINC